MPVPRRQSLARRRLDIDVLYQLATGIPRPQCSASAWGLPRRWRDDEREKILAEMRAVWNEHRAEVIAFAAELFGSDRPPWAQRHFEKASAA